MITTFVAVTMTFVAVTTAFVCDHNVRPVCRTVDTYGRLGGIMFYGLLIIGRRAG
ncbi:hypothetical protein ACTMTI_12940 [Nonomuraea sp. H19]|uniref:hypothetical protein n=1 Tax=Nonomuraea sp. H19 TaxID=3452206 RepID=UPI003F8CAA27